MTAHLPAAAAATAQSRREESAARLLWESPLRRRCPRHRRPGARWRAGCGAPHLRPPVPPHALPHRLPRPRPRLQPAGRWRRQTLLQRRARPGLRHSVQHCQTTDQSLFFWRLLDHCTGAGGLFPFAAGSVPLRPSDAAMPTPPTSNRISRQHLQRQQCTMYSNNGSA